MMHVVMCICVLAIVAFVVIFMFNTVLAVDIVIDTSIIIHD